MNDKIKKSFLQNLEENSSTKPLEDKIEQENRRKLIQKGY